jgi:hypothetical protein
MTACLTIRPVFDEAFADLAAAIHAASKLELTQHVFERLYLLCEGGGNLNVCGDLRPAAAAGEYDLPIIVKLPVADTLFLAALRAGDVGTINHLNCSSVGTSTIPTVSAAEIGITVDPADGNAP